MERKLAHIEEVVSVSPIEGADKIEMVQVLGWQCVVKKGECKVGDKVIYVEVDSVMPERPEYEFLRERKFRVRTIKLRGQISQGLVIRLGKSDCEPKVGTDMTEALGITKYLTPTEREDNSTVGNRIYKGKNPVLKYLMRYKWFRTLIAGRKIDTSFPYWVSKTDEERVQNLGDNFIKNNADRRVYVTEKIDYQSGTWTSQRVYMFNGLLRKWFPFYKVIYRVASRNQRNIDKNSLYWKISNKYYLETLCRRYPGIIIQGEQGTTNVQGNKYRIGEPRMWVFNIIMPDGRQLNYREMQIFCIEHGLECVPFVCQCHLSVIGSTVKEVVEFSKGVSQVYEGTMREGVVIRCIEDGKKVISFKAINPDFLLKYEN